MVERRDGARLGFESAMPIRPIDKVFQQDLDGDGAIQAGIPRRVDLTHPADANQ
jgi:hypothetical protein